MKFPNWTSPLIAFAAVLVSLAPAHGALLAFDDFESYTATTAINGQNGGTGWSAAWGGTGAATVQSGVIPGSGKSLRIDANGDFAATRLFSSQTGTVYLGFQLRTLDIGDDDFFQAALTDSAGNKDASGSGGIFTDTAKSFFARVGKASDGSNITGGSAANATTYQFVLKVSRTGTTYDTADVYVDQATETGAITRTGTLTITDLAKIGFRTANLDSGDAIYIDNVRVATTYAFAIPEPGSAALLVLGCLGFLRRRR